MAFPSALANASGCSRSQEAQMHFRIRARMKNGKLYNLEPDGKYFYVSKPFWLGKKAVGRARTEQGALELARSDAASTVTKID